MGISKKVKLKARILNILEEETVALILADSNRVCSWAGVKEIQVPRTVFPMKTSPGGGQSHLLSGLYGKLSS